MELNNIHENSVQGDENPTNFMPEPPKSSGTISSLHERVGKIITLLGFLYGSSGCPKIDIDKMDEMEEPIRKKPDQKPKQKKGEPNLAPLQKKLLKRPGAVYDHHVGTVICPPRVKQIINEPVITMKICGDDVTLRVSAMAAFRRAVKRVGCIKVYGSIRQNSYQNKLYEEKMAGKRKFAAHPCTGAHELAQAIDVRRSKKIREALLAEGFMDGVCNDFNHFEYQRRFWEYNKKCSKYNGHYGYSGKMVRTIGKIGRKIKKTGGRIRSWFQKLRRRRRRR